jgi:predicted lipid-binding transport protein (Tim44 family)
MENGYQSITAICLFLMMTAASNAENTQNVAPPAQPSKDMGMQHGMGGGMGMQHGMGGMGMHHGMGGMMEGMTEEQKDQHLRSMQEHMLKMHDLSNQILAEKDAAKKEQLKTGQLQLMKAHHAKMKEHRQQMKHPSKK